MHTGGGGGGGDKPVNSGSMDTRETATDGISSTTTGSEAMITDEGSRTDRYTLLLLMKGIKYWLAININDGYLSLSVCHTVRQTSCCWFNFGIIMMKLTISYVYRVMI